MNDNVWNYWSALTYLFKVGGSIDKEVYPNGEDAITVTYIRFDEPVEWGRYFAFDNDGYLIGYGNTKSKVEEQMGVLG